MITAWTEPSSHKGTAISTHIERPSVQTNMVRSDKSVRIIFDTAPGMERSRSANVKIPSEDLLNLLHSTHTAAQLRAGFISAHGGPELAVAGIVGTMGEKDRAALIMDLMTQHTVMKLKEAEGTENG
jgi:hypothetical protein